MRGLPRLRHFGVVMLGVFGKPLKRKIAKEKIDQGTHATIWMDGSVGLFSLGEIDNGCQTGARVEKNHEAHQGHL